MLLLEEYFLARSVLGRQLVPHLLGELNEDLAFLSKRVLLQLQVLVGRQTTIL